MTQNPQETGAHRMADPYVRTRTALMLTVIATIGWVAVTLLGRAGGPYAASELPDIAGLPVLAPQIQRLVPPRDVLPEGFDPNGTSAPQPTGGTP